MRLLHALGSSGVPAWGRQARRPQDGEWTAIPLAHQPTLQQSAACRAAQQPQHAGMLPNGGTCSWVAAWCIIQRGPREALAAGRPTLSHVGVVLLGLLEKGLLDVGFAAGHAQAGRAFSCRQPRPTIARSLQAANRVAPPGSRAPPCNTPRPWLQAQHGVGIHLACLLEVADAPGAWGPACRHGSAGGAVAIARALSWCGCRPLQPGRPGSDLVELPP